MLDDYGSMTQEDLTDFAYRLGDNDDGSVPLGEISWSYAPDFDVSRLLSIMSAENWSEWMDEEIDVSVVDLDDPDRWAPLLHQEIFQPVVIFEHPDGTLRIWDGWHRCAAAVVKGATTMKAVFGVAPEFVPSP